MQTIFSEPFRKQFIKIKDKKIQEDIHKQITKIENFPEIGKPLRYDLKEYRSVHLSSFRLIYRLEKDRITFIYFGNRDAIYEKLAKYINYN
jgi:mRNA-degrading endonuclease RelE of RelBE toxin-antitoxin system